MEQLALPVVWADIDVGKTHNWVCAVDEQGTTLLSKKIAHDEAEITAVAAALLAPGRELVWVVDIIGAPRRCCWRCWHATDAGCGMPRVGWSRR